MTEQEAYQQLAALCARSEHCRWDMAMKMRRWELSDEAQQRVLERLERERYVDDRSFAAAFVKDKVRYGKWGRRKIEQALWQKHVDEDIRREALDAVDDREYLTILAPMLRQKSRTVRAANDYERNQKLIRFALGRGYTTDLIRQCLNVEVADDLEEMDDELVESAD